MRWRFWIPIIIIVLVSGAAFFYFHKTKVIRPNAIVTAPSPSQQKIFLIGLDGASWNLINPLLKQGKLPHFQQLIQTGTYASLKSFVPTKSPILWTSIATGKVPKKHGIGNFTAEKDGKVIPVSGTQRITKAFWNILSEYGITVGVVNWWVTWPPEKVNGFVVSDRYRESSSQKYKGKMVFTYPEELMQELPKVQISM